MNSVKASSKSSTASDSNIRLRFPSFKSLMVLFKARIVSLLLFAALGGAFLGAQGWPSFGNLILLLITGGCAAAGSAALNQYFERDSDALMNRTKKRPLVSGEIEKPAWVPYVATIMIFVPSLLVLPFNPQLTFFLLLGAFIYVPLYTLFLKPRTLLNIVIGGAAGSAAVLSGSAAVGNWNDSGAIILALLVFLWTPSHFWSLAIVYRDDYALSNTPMLPVQTTPRKAALWVLLHTVATSLSALVLTLHVSLGWLYFIPVFIATIDMINRNIKLIRDPIPSKALDLFKASNIYLAIVLLMICIDAPL